MQRFRWWEVVGGVAFLLSPFIAAAVKARSSGAAYLVVAAIVVAWASVAAFGAGRAFRHH